METKEQLISSIKGWINIDNDILAVSTVSKIGSLSSCKSLLYAKGRDFMSVSKDTKLP